ncbi:hypothetical protein HDK64DRAFT_258913 [Phyllosticta capitalensis]
MSSFANPNVPTTSGPGTVPDNGKLPGGAPGALVVVLSTFGVLVVVVAGALGVQKWRRVKRERRAEEEEEERERARRPGSGRLFEEHELTWVPPPGSIGVLPPAP